VDAWLLLDTGATVTVLSTSLAGRLGIRPESTKSRLSQVADGRVIETFRTNVDLLDVGPKQKYNTEVAIMPINGPVTGFDGLLGMSFLEGLRYHLDLNTQTIEWQ
jgi:clan AA aspartic protease (TIGR02281 family)